LAKVNLAQKKAVDTAGAVEAAAAPAAITGTFDGIIPGGAFNLGQEWTVDLRTCGPPTGLEKNHLAKQFPGF